MRPESVRIHNFLHKEKYTPILERITCQKKVLEKLCLSKLCGGFIGVPERMKTMQLKLENLKEPLKKIGKSFYAYVRSKQKVRDKVGPLENNSGNIISDGFQMAEVLYEYFSSVVTTEDISSLPFLFTKFEGSESEHLGQLVVTPEMIAKKN